MQTEMQQKRWLVDMLGPCALTDSFRSVQVQGGSLYVLTKDSRLVSALAHDLRDSVEHLFSSTNILSDALVEVEPDSYKIYQVDKRSGRRLPLFRIKYEQTPTAGCATVKSCNDYCGAIQSPQFLEAYARTLTDRLGLENK